MTKFNQPVEKAIDDLLMDEKNPRIPEDKQSLSQDDLALFVAETYDSLIIAKSISAHQYFPSEPLIAIPKGNKFIVVEGNRRLAALKILFNSQLRNKLSNHEEWKKLGLENVPKKVPVVIVKNRREVAPVIGFRHISGIEPWDPYAKARYIASEVDAGLTFEKVAKEIGERTSEVRAHYRNYRIAQQVKKLKLDPKMVEGMVNNFGVFTRAMQGDVAEFIGAPTPDKVVKGKDPVSYKKKDSLKELVGYIFGPNPIINDSRQLTSLGKVLNSKDGLKNLRESRNLNDAVVASGGLLERLKDRLSDAIRNLRAAKDDIPKFKKDSSVKKMIEDCRKILDEIEKL